MVNCAIFDHFIPNMAYEKYRLNSYGYFVEWQTLVRPLAAIKFEMPISKYEMISNEKNLMLKTLRTPHLIHALWLCILRNERKKTRSWWMVVRRENLCVLCGCFLRPSTKIFDMSLLFWYSLRLRVFMWFLLLVINIFTEDGIPPNKPCNDANNLLYSLVVQKNSIVA